MKAVKHRGARFKAYPFGPERIITKASANVLYELDGKPVLELYRKFLGEHAENLPKSASLFPFFLRLKDSNEPVVRTIVAVNQDDQSITFAGELPEGSSVRFMMADKEALEEGVHLSHAGG
jgi:hypothetical protein